MGPEDPGEEGGENQNPPTSCQACKHRGQKHVAGAKTLLPQVQSLARSAQTREMVWRAGQWGEVQAGPARGGGAGAPLGGWGGARSLSRRGQWCRKQVAAALNARARVGCEQSQ